MTTCILYWHMPNEIVAFSGSKMLTRKPCTAVIDAPSTINNTALHLRICVHRTQKDLCFAAIDVAERTKCSNLVPGSLYGQPTPGHFSRLTAVLVIISITF